MTESYEVVSSAQDWREKASPGSIGGSSSDAGNEYRRRVVAHIVSCGLAGLPLEGFGVPTVDALVQSVALETERALDDIRAEFTSGWAIDIQAKRTLAKGAGFKKAVLQWVEAAKKKPDVRTTRLVIVAGSISQPLKKLGRVLERLRTDIPGPPTKAESESLDYFHGLISELSKPERELLVRCAVIRELDVEEADSTGAMASVAALMHVVKSSDAVLARKAWDVLSDSAGKLARLRAGFVLKNWLEALRHAGIGLASEGGTPSAHLERLELALSLYKNELKQAGSVIQLRGLGAQIPTIQISSADAGLRVSSSTENSAWGSDLLWAYLRRGRVILTGLPGSGKSTALRQVTARLCDLPGAPLPIYASLREIHAAGTMDSFRDRLLAIALRGVPASERQVLTVELERLLTNGGAVLILDSLDETYDGRAEVVGQIESFLCSVSEDVDVLLATRDVAYGYAATLGWEPLRLLPPKEIETTIGSIIRCAATQRSLLLGKSEADTWVDERESWVTAALSANSALRETPLMPILLAILATEKEHDELPRQRALIVKAVVEAAMVRHELSRPALQPLGNLSGSSILQTATQHAFECEAAAIMRGNGQPSLSQLTEMVAGDIRSQWDQSIGESQATANDAIRFFDESGIFIISGSKETVAPRIEIFAEIGAAMYAVAHPENLDSWVQERISLGQLETVVLAAGLDALAAEAFASAAVVNGDRLVIRAASQAIREGAVVAPAHAEAILAWLIEDMGKGADDGWGSWRTIKSLPLDQNSRQQIVLASKAYDPERQALVIAELDLLLGFDDPHLFQHHVTALIAIERLPLMKVEREAAQRRTNSINVQDLIVSSELHNVQLAAAKLILSSSCGVTPEMVSLLMAKSRTNTGYFGQELRKIIENAGYQVDEKEPSSTDIMMRSLRADLESGHERMMLEVLANRPKDDLNYRERTRMEELSSLLETLALNDPGSQYLFGLQVELPNIINLTETLFAFNSRVVSGQAALLLDQMSSSNDEMETYYGIFEKAVDRSEQHWESVRDVNGALALLQQMALLGKPHVLFVARCLLNSSIGEQAVPMLRNLLLSINATYHQRTIALTLCSLLESPEPACWSDEPNPVLRRIAAEYAALDSDGRIPQELPALLGDMDGYVREAALQRYIDLGSPELGTILPLLVEMPEAGWMCLSCRTVNSPGASSCSRPKCLRAAPHPEELVEALIAASTEI